MIFVSHDLALVAEVAITSRLCTPARLSSRRPPGSCSPTRFTSTRGLLGSVLSIESGSGRLHAVPGAVPSAAISPRAIASHPRSSHPRIGLDTVRSSSACGTEHFFRLRRGAQGKWFDPSRGGDEMSETAVNGVEPIIFLMTSTSPLGPYRLDSAPQPGSRRPGCND
ncbi:MAG: hypothetical protein ACLS3M_11950 [Collinsella sp.]